MSTFQFWDAMTAAQNFNRGGVMRCGCLRPPSSDCPRLQMIVASGFAQSFCGPAAAPISNPNQRKWIATGPRELQPLHSSYGTRTPRY